MNETDKPLRNPPIAGEPVVQPRKEGSALLAEVPKTYLALGVIVGIFVAGVSLRDTVKAMFAADAQASSQQSNRDRQQDEVLMEVRLDVRAHGVEIQNVQRGLENMARGMEWTNARLLEQAQRQGLNPPMPPDLTPVQTPANRPR